MIVLVFIGYWPSLEDINRWQHETPIWERALEPKQLVTIQGGHFDPYLRQFPTSSAAAVAWFREHLS